MVDESCTTAACVMDPDPVVLKPDDIVRTAAQFIMDKRYRNLPVIDEQGCYLGVFGVNCLLRQVLPKAVMIKDGLTNLGFIHESIEDLQRRFGEIADKPISRCINTENPTVAPETPLIEALYTMYQNRTSLPVVDPDTNKLAGVISYWDVGKKVLAKNE